MAAKVAIDKRSVRQDDGSRKVYPAIDRVWKKEVSFVQYPVPPKRSALSDGSAAWEEWADVVGLLEDDLTWALSLEYHRFWSQLVFDESLQSCIDSFLKNAPRHYDWRVSSLEPDMAQKIAGVERLFFLLILRMATHKESDTDFFTARAFAEIVYENYLFDIPKIVDLCTIFHRSNPAIVEKMVDNIFTQQPRFLDDLRASAPSFLQVFHMIEEKCNPQGGMASAKNWLVSFEPAKLTDLILYACDVSHSLLSFLECYTPANEIFFQNNICIELPNFYGEVVTELSEAVTLRPDSDFSSCMLDKTSLHCQLGLCMENLVKIYRLVLNSYTLLPLLETSGKPADPQLGYTFIETLTICLSQPKFFLHYNSLYPVADDKDMLAQLSIPLDSSQVSVLQEGLTNIVGSSKSVAIPPSPAALAPSSAAPAAERMPPQKAAQASPGPVDETASLISQVKELFPDLGDGFVEECLQAMGMNAERVVNAIIEDSLPPNLKSLDQQMERKPAPIPESSLLSQRKCVFDNDEFDLFNRTDVDQSGISWKKQVKSPDDAELSESLRAKIHAAAEAPSEDEEEDPLYNDDYDDTYDGHEVGAADNYAEEFTVGRSAANPLNPARALASDDSSPEDSQPTSSSADRAPEKSSAYRRRGPGPDRYGQPGHLSDRRGPPANGAMGHDAPHNAPPPAQRPNPPEKKHDVKGKAKGQGQTKDVLHNRKFKDKHKSSMANHNRKKGADRKMAGGMF